MNPVIDVRPLIEADEYAVWLVDNFDLNSLQTRAQVPTINRKNGKAFTSGSVHAVLKGGTWATGTLSVMVSNEYENRERDLAAHPSNITKTAGGAGWASAAFSLQHYWLGFQPTLVESAASLLKLYVVLRHSVDTVATGATGASGTARIRFKFSFNGGGSVPSTGLCEPTVADVACTITKASIFGTSGATGSAVVDIKKSTYTNWPTTASICAAAKPTITSANKNQDSTLTGWTTSITAGDVIEANLDSVSTFTNVTVMLEGTVP